MICSYLKGPYVPTWAVWTGAHTHVPHVQHSSSHVHARRISKALKLCIFQLFWLCRAPEVDLQAITDLRIQVACNIDENKRIWFSLPTGSWMTTGNSNRMVNNLAITLQSFRRYPHKILYYEEIKRNEWDVRGRAWTCAGRAWTCRFSDGRVPCFRWFLAISHVFCTQTGSIGIKTYWNAFSSRKL